MFTCIIISIYRILAAIIIALPIVINTLLHGNIVVSFIYIPLLCLLLTSVAIYLDKKLITALLHMPTSFTLKRLRLNTKEKTTNI